MKKMRKSLGLMFLMFVSVLFSFNTNTVQAANFYTAADVAAHSTASDCWMILSGNVYDLTSFLPSHSGGASSISPKCGQDGTSLFSGRHSASYLNQLNTYLLGTLTVPVLNSIVINPSTSSVVVGETKQLVVSTLDQNGSPITSTTSYSSSNTSIATVNNSGLVTSIAKGSAIITVTSTKGSVTKTGTSTITVTAPVQVPTLTSVSVTPVTSSIMVGESKQLQASTLDQNGSPISATVTYSSNNTSVASVNSAGLVNGVSNGIATITTTAVSGSVTVTATSQVTVKQVPVLTSIIITPASSSITVGGEQQLAVSTLDQSENPIAATITFSSSNTAVATVDEGGLVTAVSNGTTTITATAVNGSITLSGTSEITVKEQTLTSISVTPVTASIAVGGVKQLTVKTLDQNGSPMSSIVTYSSSNEALATVNNGGLVTGLSDGVVTITATAYGATALTATSQITITSDAIAPVIKMLGKSPISIIVGSKYTDAGATATDNLDGNITSKIVTVNNVNVSKVGTYTVTYNVTDTKGNAATPVVRTVKVIRRSSSGGSSSGSTVHNNNDDDDKNTTTTEGCDNRNRFSVTNGHPCVSGGDDNNGSVLGSEKYHFTLYMRNGSKGNEIKELQKLLNTKGYSVGIEDGSFGSKTKNAIIKFQIANGLKCDGIIGAITRSFLNK